MRRLLDTTVLIEIVRGSEAALALVARLEEPPLVSVVSVHELLVGLRPREERQAELLVAGVTLVEVGLEEARLSAAWRREHAGRGVTLSLPDTMIAACAVTHAAVLLTANATDVPMPELRVETWPTA